MVAIKFWMWRSGGTGGASRPSDTQIHNVEFCDFSKTKTSRRLFADCRVRDRAGEGARSLCAGAVFAPRGRTLSLGYASVVM